MLSSLPKASPEAIGLGDHAHLGHPTGLHEESVARVCLVTSVWPEPPPGPRNQAVATVPELLPCRVLGKKSE